MALMIRTTKYNTGTLQALVTTTYLQSNLEHQDMDSIQFQCTQTSSSSQEPDLSHNCRTRPNLLLCLCSFPEIHSVEWEVDHSQLK